MRKPLALFALTALSGCAGLFSNVDSTPTDDCPNAEPDTRGIGVLML